MNWLVVLLKGDSDISLFGMPFNGARPRISLYISFLYVSISFYALNAQTCLAMNKYNSDYGCCWFCCFQYHMAN